MAEVTANIKYLRISPKKLRELLPLVLKMKVNEALDQLKFINKSGCRPLMSAIESAIGSAKNNLKLAEENLMIRNIEISQGPKFKRFRAVSRGSAHGYAKKTSHIKVILGEMKNNKEGLHGTKD